MQTNLMSYCESGEIDKVLTTLENLSTNTNKKHLLKTLIKNIIEPVWKNFGNSVIVPESTLWRSLSSLFIKSKDKNLKIIVNKIIDRIYLPNIKCFNENEIKTVYKSLKTLSNDTDNKYAKALVTRLSYHCLSAVKEQDPSYFNKKMISLMPNLIDSLMYVNKDSYMSSLKINNYFFKEKNDENLFTTIEICLKSFLEDDAPTPEKLETALEITKLLEADLKEKDNYIKSILEGCLKQHKNNSELFESYKNEYLTTYKNGLLLLKEEKEKIDYCEKIIDWCLEKECYLGTFSRPNHTTMIDGHFETELSEGKLNYFLSNTFKDLIEILPKETVKIKLENKIKTLSPQRDEKQIELLKKLI